MPSIFAGMKVAISLALVGTIVGEFVAAQHGLGYVILSAQGVFDTARVFVALVHSRDHGNSAVLSHRVCRTENPSVACLEACRTEGRPDAKDTDGRDGPLMLAYLRELFAYLRNLVFLKTNGRAAELVVVIDDPA